MARRAFFSFHYERDVWRAGQVRNSWVTQPNRETAGFWDAASWEQVKRNGEDAVKRWIDRQLQGTSVTVLLIGAETSTRYYVDYEIEQSSKIGNGLLGIYINNIRNQLQQIDTRGPNPFDHWYRTINGQQVFFSRIYSTYDWVDDNGYANLGSWIETAAKQAGR